MKFVRMTFDRILIKNSQNQLKQPKSVLISGNDSQKTETRNVICFEKKLNSLLSSVHLTKFLKLSLQGLQCLIDRWMSRKQEQKSKIQEKLRWFCIIINGYGLHSSDVTTTSMDQSTAQDSVLKNSRKWVRIIYLFFDLTNSLI